MIFRKIVRTLIVIAWSMLLAGFVHGAGADLEPGQEEVILKVENMT
jgi:hypothetical protein